MGIIAVIHTVDAAFNTLKEFDTDKALPEILKHARLLPDGCVLKATFAAVDGGEPFTGEGDPRLSDEVRLKFEAEWLSYCSPEQLAQIESLRTMTAENIWSSIHKLDYGTGKIAGWWRRKLAKGSVEALEEEGLKEFGFKILEVMRGAQANGDGLVVAYH